MLSFYSHLAQYGTVVTSHAHHVTGLSRSPTETKQENRTIGSLAPVNTNWIQSGRYSRIHFRSAKVDETPECLYSQSPLGAPTENKME